MQNPFMPRFDLLPATLPIFPLEGVMVMPGAQLPLNIFEPRYLNMVQDAMATHHLIGMVQPRDATASSAQPVHATGGAGRITFYNETHDGRIEIVLTGVCRFDIAQELPTLRGYRLVEPDWRRFRADYEFPVLDEISETQAFFSALDDYVVANGLEIDSAAIRGLPFSLLLNVLATLLPLHHEEKQAIAEAVSFPERYQLLSGSIGMHRSNMPSHLRH